MASSEVVELSGLERFPDDIPAVAGTYCLVLRSDACAKARVGKLGTLNLRPGWYLYVGSALGPGGLRARLRRHWRIAAKPHWHIDYLRALATLVEIRYHTGAMRLEHAWANELVAEPGAEIPLSRFGASDCRCRAHLAYFAQSRRD